MIVRVSPGLVHVVRIGRIMRRIDPEKTVGGKVRHYWGVPFRVMVQAGEQAFSVVTADEMSGVPVPVL